MNSVSPNLHPLIQRWWHAVSRADATLLKDLLAQGANPQWMDKSHSLSAIEHLVGGGPSSLACVDVLMTAGVNPFRPCADRIAAEAPFRNALRNGESVARLMIDAFNWEQFKGTEVHQKALEWAIDLRPSLVPYMVNKGIQPLVGTDTSTLRWALNAGAVDAAQSLIQAHATLGPREKSAYQQVITPVSTIKNDVKLAMVNMLASQGFEPTGAENASLLVNAVKARASMDLIERLVTLGADVHGINRVGQTALHAAVSGAMWAWVKPLLSLGMDLLIQDKKGLTAIDILEKKSKELIHPKAVDLFVELQSKILRQAMDDIPASPSVVKHSRARL